MSSHKGEVAGGRELQLEAFASSARDLLAAAEWGLLQLEALPPEMTGRRVLSELVSGIHADASTMVSGAESEFVDSCLHARFVAMRAALCVDAAKRTLEPVGGHACALAIASGPAIFEAAAEIIQLARQRLEH